MSAFINFAILGIATGAPVGMLAMGMVASYRGSRVVNFAQAAIALVGAYVFLELDTRVKVGVPLAIAGGLLASVCVSLAEQVLILKRLQRASQLTQVVATVGVLIVIEQTIAFLVPPGGTYVPSFLPTEKVNLLGDRVSLDLLLTVAIVVVLWVAVYALYRFTQFGRLTTASLDNSRTVSALGHSVSVIAGLNWAVGGCLTGVGAILLAPLIGVSVESFSLLLLSILAAGIFGQFRSFGWGLGGALLVGIIQSELGFFSSATSWTEATPFLIIVVLLAVRGTTKGSRTAVAERLPIVGRGVIRNRYVLLVTLLLVALVSLVHGQLWLGAVALTAGGAVVLLSVVMVTGLGGQLSLAQFTFAGLGAWFTAQLIARIHVPLAAAIVLGTFGVLLAGTLVGIVALRTRGVNLAIITVSFAAAIEYLVFNSVSLTGPEGIDIGSLKLFGFDVTFISHPYRYTFVAMLVLVGCCVAVANIRRGVGGRALLAQRANERGAASLGVNITLVRVFAFSVASVIAAIGGEIIGLSAPSVLFNSFTATASLEAVAQGVVGGVGFVLGAVTGSLAQPGAVVYQALTTGAGTNGVRYVPVALGVLVIFVVLSQPDGIVPVVSELVHKIVPGGWHLPALRMPRKRRTGAVLRSQEEPGDKEVQTARSSAHTLVSSDAGLDQGKSGSPVSLVVEDLAVRFGSVSAVDGIELQVQAGQIVGLIGANGAGKTTAVDAITGFTKYQRGVVRLGGTDLSGMMPHELAKLGVTRSFQSLELFEDLTVRENLAVACEKQAFTQYLRSVARPQPAMLSPMATAAVDVFELGRFMDVYPSNLSYGDRRLVAVARAVATGPTILFLDEPAAGLDALQRSRIADLFTLLSRNWGIGIVLVEHDLSMVFSVSDYIYLMDVGRVVASGTPNDLRDDDRLERVVVGIRH